MSPGGRRCARRSQRQRYYAIATGKGQRELLVEPIDCRITYHRVKAREVLQIWHKRRRRNNARPSDDQR
jgi:hypothetical protein